MDEVKVEQVDREAAEKVLDAILFATEPKMLSPEECEAEIVQAFARHRLASQPVPASSDLVERVAAVLLGSVNAPEQEIYRVARAIIPIIQADERESCAKVADEWEAALRPGKGVKEMAKWIATAIRKRNGCD